LKTRSRVYQDDRMAYYAQEANEILDDILGKMVGEVTSTDPDCQTIDELIAKYDALSRGRKLRSTLLAMHQSESL
jgi:hypothetical protein